MLGRTVRRKEHTPDSTSYHASLICRLKVSSYSAETLALTPKRYDAIAGNESDEEECNSSVKLIAKTPPGIHSSIATPTI